LLLEEKIMMQQVIYVVLASALCLVPGRGVDSYSVQLDAAAPVVEVRKYERGFSYLLPAGWQTYDVPKLSKYLIGVGDRTSDEVTPNFNIQDDDQKFLALDAYVELNRRELATLNLKQIGQARRFETDAGLVGVKLTYESERARFYFYLFMPRPGEQYVLTGTGQRGAERLAAIFDALARSFKF